MQIIKKSVKELIPYARNSRTHGDEQISQIMASITEFGFTNPILIDEKNEIIAGHGRLIASQRLKLENVPCIVLSGLTEAQKKAYIIADNKIAINAGWDEDLLKLELIELDEIGFDLELTGFSIEELAEMDLNIDDFPRPDESKVDDVPEAVDNPVIKLGDMIELGNHRLLCGDSTDKKTVEKLMNGIKADICFTDPDYAMENDHWINCILEIALKENNPFFIMASDKQQARYVQKIPNFRKFFAGIRAQPVMVSQYVPMNKLTLVSYFGGTPSKFFNNLKDQFTDVFDFTRKASENEENEGHRHYKNVEVPTHFLKHYAQAGANVVDLFGGSGSTLIASDMLDMNCYVCELQPTYVQLIIERYCQYSSIYEIKINGKSIDWENYKSNV